MVSVRALMREIYETDPQISSPAELADKVFDATPSDEYGQAYRQLLPSEASSFMSSWRGPSAPPQEEYTGVTEETDQESQATGRPVRKTPPRTYSSEDSLRMEEQTRIQVPSQKCWVMFKDMTADYWESVLADRRKKMAGYGYHISLMENLVKEMVARGVTVSVNLPEDIKSAFLTAYRSGPQEGR